MQHNPQVPLKENVVTAGPAHSVISAPGLNFEHSPDDVLAGEALLVPTAEGDVAAVRLRNLRAHGATAVALPVAAGLPVLLVVDLGDQPVDLGHGRRRPRRLAFYFAPALAVHLVDRTRTRAADEVVLVVVLVAGVGLSGEDGHVDLLGVAGTRNGDVSVVDQLVGVRIDEAGRERTGSSGGEGDEGREHREDVEIDEHVDDVFGGWFLLR